MLMEATKHWSLVQLIQGWFEEGAKPSQHVIRGMLSYGRFRRNDPNRGSSLAGIS